MIFCQTPANECSAGFIVITFSLPWGSVNYLSTCAVSFFVDFSVSFEYHSIMFTALDDGKLYANFQLSIFPSHICMQQVVSNLLSRF